MRVVAGVTGRVLRIEVLDEGEGFDPAIIPDPTDPTNLLRASGRGLYLIGTFMERVEFNDVGNRITMNTTLAEASDDGASDDDDDA